MNVLLYSPGGASSRRALAEPAQDGLADRRLGVLGSLDAGLGVGLADRRRIGLVVVLVPVVALDVLGGALEGLGLVAEVRGAVLRALARRIAALLAVLGD